MKLSIVSILLFAISIIQTGDAFAAPKAPACYRIADQIHDPGLTADQYWQILCPKKFETPDAPIMHILNDLKKKRIKAFCTLDGTLYEKRKFRDEFARQLYFGDPQLSHSSGEVGSHEEYKSQLISEAFEKHLATLPVSNYRNLKNAIVEYVDFFGVDNTNGEKILRQLYGPILERNEKKVKAFLGEVSEKMKVYVDGVAARGPGDDHVAVVYSTSGGAHSSIANVLETVLEQDGYQVAKVNESEIYRENDILSRAVGIDRADIYNQVSQQGGRDWCRKRLHELQIQLEKYIPNTNMDILRRSVGRSKVIASTGHKPYNVRLVSDGRKVAFQVCDFGQFTAKLSGVAETVLKFGLGGITFHCPSESTTLVGKDMTVDFSSPEAQQKYSQFVKIHSYPVHEAFKKMPAEEGRQDVIARYHLRSDAKIITMAMGQQGVGGVLENYIDSLMRGVASDPNPPKIDCLVMRGRNSKMEKTLSQHFQSKLKVFSKESQTKILEKLSLIFIPRVSQAEVAAIGRVSDVFLSKPGGGTTAEALAARFPMVVHLDPHHPWEADNAAELQKELESPILKPGEEHEFYKIAKEMVSRKRAPFVGSTAEREESIDYTLKVLFNLETSIESEGLPHSK